MIKKSINTFLNIIQLLLIAVLVLSVSLIIFTAFSPIKKFQIFRVMSGSMEPTVKTGSIILVEKIDPQKLELRDIIAFSQTNDKNVVVTHRLLEVVKKESQIVFLTKGDANKDTNEEVLSSQIKGKVIFSVPFLGYLSAWLKTPLGLLLLVFLPALLVIINEIFSIKNIIEEEIRKKYENKKERDFENVDGTKSTNFVIPAAIILFVILFRFNSIHAFFSSTITASNNTFTMGTWSVPTPTPTPTPPITNPDVVINEIMWMGSTESIADEWIELRNMTDHEIDIGQWTLDNTKDSADRKLMLSASKNIPAHGYFLIANYPKNSANSALNVDVDEVANLKLLNSNNGNVILKNKDGIIIDQAKGDSWPAGINTTVNQSMERKDTPGDGTNGSNWKTCTDSHCNDTTYWDSKGNNYGTPKYPNL